MKRLVLIDGNAILHRAYHALPPLTAPDGSLVNAVYGFTSMLLKIFHDLQPTHLAVTFDRPAPTFRKKLYKKYQAQRPEMEEDLSGQVATVHDVVAAFDIPIFEVDGFEADDVIGTLVKKAKHEGIDQVIVVTGDRDLLQLVDNKVFVYMLVRGLTDAKLYDQSEVFAKLGIKPEQIPDFKALAGDASDNYPGVSGIGPKTAAELLVDYHSLDALYKRAEAKQHGNLPDALAEKLMAGKESAEIGIQLAQIRSDVPLNVSLAEVAVHELNTPQARKELTKLNFQSLLKRLAGKKADDKKSAEKKRPKKEKTATGEQQQLF